MQRNLFDAPGALTLRGGPGGFRRCVYLYDMNNQSDKMPGARFAPRVPQNLAYRSLPNGELEGSTKRSSGLNVKHQEWLRDSDLT
jgi:hypothetical protein